MSIRKILFKLCDELFERKDENTKEIFPKKSALLFQKNDLSTYIWYLYQIHINENTQTNNELGFIVPSKLIELPTFKDGLSTINIMFRKQINYFENKNLFEQFSRHIFENIFDNAMLEFNIRASSFKLLICLLTNSNEIDFIRMLNICHRHKKSIEHPLYLSDTELYTVWYLPTKPLVIFLSNVSRIKRALDRRTTSQTYADYYEEIIPNIYINKDLIMGSMKMINKRKIILNKHEDLIISSDQTIYYYPIELLHYAPLNQSDLILISKFPSILVRLVQLHHIEQLRKLFAKNIQCYNLSKSNEVSFKDCLTEYMHIVSLNRLNYDFSISHEQPSADILFQAITRRSVNEHFDMENLEILGDCFLKLAISMSLYYQYPLANAGELTKEKTKEISNENLYRLAVENKLKNYLYNDKIIFQGYDSNWLSPGYINKINNNKNKYTHQKAKRKAFADMIEAFIGAFLLSSNYITTIRFMHWLGLNVIPVDQNDHILSIPPIIPTQLDNEIRRIFHDEEFEEIEYKLNYVFQNKAYLISAYTHPSKSQNSILNSYERLEFLGDALLDFLVIRHTFLNYDRNLTPGRVTDIRQDLSNNNRLAYILVSANLHTKIRLNSNELLNRIKSYINNENLFPKNQSNNNRLNQNIYQRTDSTTPKILADVFEALIAAIFFDSNNSLEIVWKVIEPFLGTLFDRSIIDPNLNPIRSFIDKGGKILAEFVNETGAVCLVQMPNGTLYEGYGESKKRAKYDACQQAMNYKI
ncbi:unnamed protein product [Rotaria sordida]|uniref:RNase III domain-containing protein n=1 Tax=Rotaria sordida TaxID=392033 RepID=A0A818MU72_9BILA|nr:unnamed protein product [Rotaria sordida]